MGLNVQYAIVYAILLLLAVAVVRHFINIAKRKGGCPNCSSRECCCNRDKNGRKKCCE